MIEKLITAHLKSLGFEAVLEDHNPPMFDIVGYGVDHLHPKYGKGCWKRLYSLDEDNHTIYMSNSFLTENGDYHDETSTDSYPIQEWFKLVPTRDESWISLIQPYPRHETA